MEQRLTQAAIDRVLGTDLLVRAAFHGQSDVTALLEVSKLFCCTIAELHNHTNGQCLYTSWTTDIRDKQSWSLHGLNICFSFFCTAERVNAPISQAGVDHVSDVLVTAACQGQPDITALLEVSNVPVLPLNPLQFSLEMQIASLCQSVSLLFNE